MENLIAPLVLVLLITVVFGAIALPIVLVVGSLRGSASVPAASYPGPPWTDDDEIAARNHH